MPTRHRVLLAIIAISLATFIVSGVFSPNWSIGDVLSMAAFTVIFFFVTFLLLLSRGSKPVDGHRGLPRSLWVLFASFAAAFALAMFGAVLSLPWFGYKGFEFLLGGEGGWWILPTLAAIAYPFVNRRLL